MEFVENTVQKEQHLPGAVSIEQPHLLGPDDQVRPRQVAQPLVQIPLEH